MSVLHLRKMTFKSIIGFGKYPTHSVQQIIDIGRMSELVYMYYNLDRIDFIPEVKKVLCIELEINKPGKLTINESKEISYQCIKKYIELAKHEKPSEGCRLYALNKSVKINTAKKREIKDSLINSKSFNKKYNQKP